VGEQILGRLDCPGKIRRAQVEAPQQKPAKDAAGQSDYRGDEESQSHASSA
jgi:hypothetical protein